MSGRVRKRSAFEWHTGQDTAPPSIRIRHSDININTGSSSVQSSSIVAPASPSRAAHVDYDYRDDYLLHQMGVDMEVDDGLGGDGLGGGDEDDVEAAIDPKYQLHRDENHPEAAHTRQKRAQVRCSNLYTLHSSLKCFAG